jgi:hypothetical protein
MRDFVESGNANDCEAAVDLLTQESWALIMAASEGTRQVLRSPTRAEAIESCRKSTDDSIDETIDAVHLVSEDGDRAVVSITTTSEGEARTDEFVLTREDGSWKLDLLASATATSSRSDTTPIPGS